VVDLAEDRRALTARVRADLHHVVRALAARDYEAAAAKLVAGDEPWTADRLSRAMAAYWAAHKVLLATPAARQPKHTRIDELEPRRFRAQQVLLDPEGDEDWALDCIVDLTEPKPEGTPLLDLQRIGI
jgi:hypothetical protein